MMWSSGRLQSGCAVRALCGAHRLCDQDFSLSLTSGVSFVSAAMADLARLVVRVTSACEGRFISEDWDAGALCARSKRCSWRWICSADV